MWYLNNENFWDPSRKWQWIIKSFGVIKDLGLNNYMHQSDLLYLFFLPKRVLHRMRWFHNSPTEAMFSIFKLKKSTKTDSNWTIKSWFILNRLRRTRWTSQFFHIEKSEDPQNKRFGLPFNSGNQNPSIILRPTLERTTAGKRLISYRIIRYDSNRMIILTFVLLPWRPP